MVKPEQLVLSTLPGKVQLLVIDGSAPGSGAQWADIFAGRTLADGRAITVLQTTWPKMRVSAESEGADRVLVHLPGARAFKPDFVLVRNECRGPSHTQDWRNALFGLMYANIPSVNSLHSIYCHLERPVVQAELNKIQRTLGSDRFPLIRQQYFASHREMMYSQPFPAVVKVPLEQFASSRAGKRGNLG